MANPQLKNGYTPIANEILDNLVKLSLNGTQWRIIIVVWRFTYGFSRKAHEISETFLQRALGFDRAQLRQIKRELSALIKLNIITVIREKQFLNGFESLILLADNDEAGINMQRAFVKEFGYKVKLPDRNQFKGLKDINEIYLKHGEDQVVKLISSATVKIEGLRNLDTEPYKGIDLTGKYIPTGIPTIDYAINDLAPGLVTLVTGRSNGGKSTFVNQIMCNAIDQGNKVLLVAGEGLQELIINNLYKAVISRDASCFEYVKVNKRFFKEPKPEVLKALQRWHKGRFTLFNKGESKLKTTDELFEILSLEIRTDRPDLLVIDNLMSVLSVEKATEKLERQADFMQRCCDLTKCEKVHLILVLHPNKTASKHTGMDFEQISGTQDLANKADNIILVRRYYSTEVEGSDIDGQIEVLKNRYFGDLPKVETFYDIESGMLLEINAVTGDHMAYSFRWRQYLEENSIRMETRTEKF